METRRTEDAAHRDNWLSFDYWKMTLFGSEEKRRRRDNDKQKKCGMRPIFHYINKVEGINQQ